MDGSAVIYLFAYRYHISLPPNVCERRRYIWYRVLLVIETMFVYTSDWLNRSVVQGNGDRKDDYHVRLIISRGPAHVLSRSPIACYKI